MLLGSAKRDADALQVMHRSDEISDEVFGFHVQQAAEKAFKAWLGLLGEIYPLTHNLDILLDLLAGRGASQEPFRGLVDFTPYAVEFRYAGVDSGTEPIDREGSLALVEALLARVRDELADAERL